MSVFPWDYALHELIKHGHGECRVPVVRAPDHAFRNERAACWRE